MKSCVVILQLVDSIMDLEGTSGKSQKNLSALDDTYCYLTATLSNIKQNLSLLSGKLNLLSSSKFALAKPSRFLNLA
jgi:hypothetical protein